MTPAAEAEAEAEIDADAESEAEIEAEIEAATEAETETPGTGSVGAAVGPGTATLTDATGTVTAPMPGMEIAPAEGRVAAAEPEIDNVAPADSDVTPAPGIERVATPADTETEAEREALGARHTPPRQTLPKRHTLRSLPQLRLSVSKSTMLPPAAVAVAEAPAERTGVLEVVVVGATQRPL
jgi:hypothetical protein